MRTLVGIAIAVVVLLAGIAFVVYAQFRPQLDGNQAGLIAAKFLAGNNGQAWTANSETLGFDGNRPQLQDLTLGQVPKCWGPVVGDFCLPYPIWQVHLVNLGPNGQCDGSIVVVDGRTGKVYGFRRDDCGP
jgi:hypothetical protein